MQFENRKFGKFSAEKSKVGKFSFEFEKLSEVEKFSMLITYCIVVTTMTVYKCIL